MTTMTITIPSEIYDQLLASARQQGRQIEDVAQAWLIEYSVQMRTDLTRSAPAGERERAISVLRNTGLLTESGPEMKKRARRSHLTLDQARVILDRPGGKPLSEIILEMRGSKE